MFTPPQRGPSSTQARPPSLPRVEENHGGFRFLHASYGNPDWEIVVGSNLDALQRQQVNTILDEAWTNHPDTGSSQRTGSHFERVGFRNEEFARGVVQKLDLVFN